VAETTIRQFIVVNRSADQELSRAHDERDAVKLKERLLVLLGPEYRDRTTEFDVAPLPPEWILEKFEYPHGDDKKTFIIVKETPQPVPTLNIPLIFHGHDEGQVRQAVTRLRGTVANSFVGISADLPFQSTDCWCPGEAADAVFGTRHDAEAAIRAPVLQNNRLTGKKVNVVIIDRGMDPSLVSITYRWSFSTASNQIPVPSPDNHAMMVVRNVLKTAPDANIYDCALLPEHISDVGQFIMVALSAYTQMLADIAHWQSTGVASTQWVFVNAWAIYDRHLEYPIGDYTANPYNPFNVIVNKAAVQNHIDMVFAAGNCGVFCPKWNCGRDDRGPGRSILGANSHKDVLSTGAVRSDDTWLGYSSQGPGLLTQHKPDLCVPSQYRESTDAHLVNTGTSASCALAAGVIAALRSRPGWDSIRISPKALRDILVATARKTRYPAWNGKIGNGILNVEAAFNDLVRQFP
jgi:Subtilase family